MVEDPPPAAATMVRAMMIAVMAVPFATDVVVERASGEPFFAAVFVMMVPARPVPVVVVMMHCIVVSFKAEPGWFGHKDMNKIYLMIKIYLVVSRFRERLTPAGWCFGLDGVVMAIEPNRSDLR